MNRIEKIFLFSFALIALCSSESVEPIVAAETTPADELSKEEIYNINADVYCQTELIITEKLFELEEPVNLYNSILGDDVNDIDCEAVLDQYIARVYKRLRKDFMKKGSSLFTANCFMGKIKELGYDKMRYKFNALHGIEIEKEKKEEMRKVIDKEIGDTVERAVDECWPVDPVMRSSENKIKE